VAALALDLGRLYVLRTEMQNAVDAAALAAAAELNAESDAIERARLAGKGLLESDSHFSNVKELLGIGLDETTEIKFEFFCAIGNKFEQNIENLATICTGEADPADSNKLIVPTDADDDQAHYVRITLNPILSDDGGARYGIDLFFIPILNALGIDTLRHIDLKATALAGRHFYNCRYPPVMLCDPLEGMGGMEKNLEPGQQILLKTQTGTWAPGIFAFLDLDLFTGGGAGDAMVAMADETDLGCTPPEVLPEPGGMTNKTAAGVNTRFDEYRFGLTPSDFKPAPNITNYGGYDDVAQSGIGDDGKRRWRDSRFDIDFKDLDLSNPLNRIGDGDWDRVDYFNTNHPTGARPSDWATTITRKQVYDWEISSGNIPFQPTHTAGIPERRVIHVAVLSCNALGVGPGEIFPIVDPDGFAKLFITERVEDPPDTNILVEYVGWATERDEDYHVVVQLYE